MTGYVVTRWYRAPEVILNWMHYTQTGKTIVAVTYFHLSPCCSPPVGAVTVFLFVVKKRNHGNTTYVFYLAVACMALCGSAVFCSVFSVFFLKILLWMYNV